MQTLSRYRPFERESRIHRWNPSKWSSNAGFDVPLFLTQTGCWTNGHGHAMTPMWRHCYVANFQIVFFFYPLSADGNNTCCMRQYVWKYVWHSTQNILPIYWKMWLLFTGENLRALTFQNSYVFLKRPLSNQTAFDPRKIPQLTCGRPTGLIMTSCGNCIGLSIPCSQVGLNLTSY